MKFYIELFIIIAFFGKPILYSQTQKGLDIDGEKATDNFGWSVSMPDANTIAIGAIDNDEYLSEAGNVRVFTWTNNTWVQKGDDIYGETARDESGWSVSMPDANTVAIGAFENDNTGVDAGHVRVFYWDNNTWVQKGSDIDGEAASDWSGRSISMPDANTVAIGAIGNDGNGTSSGHVRVYYWDGNGWVQKGVDINGDAAGDESGWSVSMPDANTVAIGARINNTSSGHVRVYYWNCDAWIQKGVDIDGEVAGDESGWSVSMPDANTVAIGGPLNDGNGTSSGHVRVYYWNGGGWVQKGVDIDGETAGDESGLSVSMPDANTVAIGARINNTSSGHVRIYYWNCDTWVQKGVDIDGETAGDESGWSVSMPDANTLAIGARYNDGFGQNSGHIRVYFFNGY